MARKGKRVRTLRQDFLCCGAGVGHKVGYHLSSESIADENFTSEHMGYFERLTSDEKEVVFSDYLRTLAEGGLTCTEKNLVKLTQDLYPIDATPDNIRKLSTDRDALNELHIDGMVLFITGPAL